MTSRILEPIRVIRSRTDVLAADNVDTDQIIPARFLTTTGRDGFGDALFADWRFDAAGRPREGIALNAPQHERSSTSAVGDRVRSAHNESQRSPKRRAQHDTTGSLEELFVSLMGGAKGGELWWL